MEPGLPSPPPTPPMPPVAPGGAPAPFPSEKAVRRRRHAPRPAPTSAGMSNEVFEWLLSIHRELPRHNYVCPRCRRTRIAAARRSRRPHRPDINRPAVHTLGPPRDPIAEMSPERAHELWYDHVLPGIHPGLFLLPSYIVSGPRMSSDSWEVLERKIITERARWEAIIKSPKYFFSVLHILSVHHMTIGLDHPLFSFLDETEG